MENTWDERYSIEDYYYGENPNEYLQSKIETLTPGKVLLTAEGEGRNAVYCAKLGWDVFSYDTSEVAKQKAFLLANKFGVKIDYEIESHKSFTTDQKFDAIVVCFNHPPAFFRVEFHNKLVDMLKSGGYLILEGFSKNQTENSTGGPQDLDKLYDLDELKNDFKSLNIIEAEAIDTVLKEGRGHKGISSVIRIFAKKN